METEKMAGSLVSLGAEIREGQVQNEVGCECRESK